MYLLLLWLDVSNLTNTSLLSWLAGWLAGWLVGWCSWLVGWVVGWVVVCWFLVGWWLIGDFYIVSWLVGWLDDTHKHWTRFAPECECWICEATCREHV